MDLPILVENLVVRFASSRGADVRAVDGLTLRVEAGQAIGFLGPNGAGKTTAIHVMLGFIPADSGRVSLFGRDARDAAARRRIGYLPEQADAYRFLTGREWLRFTGRLCGLRGRALENRVEATLDEVDLREAADRRIATYSRGMRQRIALGQALVHEPSLLILDEPTSGLDPVARLRFRNRMAAWRAEGRTIFFSSHELSEVELVCDRVAILARGRLLAEGPPSSLVKPGERLEACFMRTVGEGGGP